jgi:type VI protein secretion system component Hcp
MGTKTTWEVSDVVAKGKPLKEQVLTFRLGGRSTPQFGYGGGHGRAAITDFTVTRKNDQYSNELVRAVIIGKHLDIKVVMEYSYEGSPPSTITYTFPDAIISSYHPMGNDPISSAEEVFDVTFEKFSYKYGK